MSEIVKMYENTGVGLRKCSECDNFNIDCGYSDDCYPPFTIEKQLKILCFIVNNKCSVTFREQIYNIDKLTLEKIQENLAWAINEIWYSLTEEEKQQVKEILK